MTTSMQSETVMDSPLPRARPDTIRKALEALENKTSWGLKHGYNISDSKEDDRRCKRKLQQLLLSSQDEQLRRS